MDTGNFRTSARNHAYEQRHGSMAASLINPTHGCRDEQYRKGMKPKNHHKENIKAMRAIADKVQMKKMTEEIEPEPFKIDRYKKVEPRYKQVVEKPVQSPLQPHNDNPSVGTARKDPKNFLKARSGTREPESAPVTPREEPSGTTGTTLRRRELTKPAVPTAAELASIPRAEARERNIIEANARKAIKKQPTMAPCDVAKLRQDEERNALKHKQGKVPDYLIERKAEIMAQKERERQLRDMEDVPPGMIQMPEDERVETLATLKTNREKLQKELDSVSITSDTLRHRQHKADLEKKLKDIDDAITIFSRKKVYIAP